MHPAYIQVNPEWFRHLSALVSHISKLENNPEDTLMVALSAREFGYLVVAQDLLYQFFPHLGEEILALVKKLAEIRDVQKPEWKEA